MYATLKKKKCREEKTTRSNDARINERPSYKKYFSIISAYFDFQQRCCIAQQPVSIFNIDSHIQINKFTDDYSHFLFASLTLSLSLSYLDFHSFSNSAAYYIVL